MVYLDYNPDASRDRNATTGYIVGTYSLVSPIFTVGDAFIVMIAEVTRLTSKKSVDHRVRLNKNTFSMMLTRLYISQVDYETGGRDPLAAAGCDPQVSSSCEEVIVAPSQPFVTDVEIAVTEREQQRVC